MLDLQEVVGQGTLLCLSCGFCCRGVLHDHVPLTEKDVERLGYIELPSYPKDVGYSAFSQPCRCYQNEKCSVYPNRPTACQAYACCLLEDLLQQRRNLDECLSLVARANTHIALLRELTNSYDETTTIWTAVEAFLARQRELEGSENYVPPGNRELGAAQLGLVSLIHKFFLPHRDP